MHTDAAAIDIIKKTGCCMGIALIASIDNFIPRIRKRSMYLRKKTNEHITARIAAVDKKHIKSLPFAAHVLKRAPMRKINANSTRPRQRIRARLPNARIPAVRLIISLK